MKIPIQNERRNQQRPKLSLPHWRRQTNTLKKKKHQNKNKKPVFSNLHHVVANNSYILSKNQKPNINLQLLPGFNPNIALMAKPDGLIIIT